jgi:hypothetical protein
MLLDSGNNAEIFDGIKQQQHRQHYAAQCKKSPDELDTR